MSLEVCLLTHFESRDQWMNYEAIKRGLFLGAGWFSKTKKFKEMYGVY